MSLFGWIIMMVVVMRVLGARRRWRRRVMAGWYAGPWSPHWTHYAYPRAAPVPPRPAAPLPPPDPFEALKSRYVQGELTDEEYERELDALLKTPEGKRTLR